MSYFIVFHFGRIFDKWILYYIGFHSYFFKILYLLALNKNGLFEHLKQKISGMIIFYVLRYATAFHHIKSLSIDECGIIGTTI